MSGKEPDVLPDGTPLRCKCGRLLKWPEEKEAKLCIMCQAGQLFPKGSPIN